MDLLVCGTAAAEAWPALFCRCEACLTARRLGGKNIRGRAGYVLGEQIKIDFGPDAAHQMLDLGLAFEKLTHLLVTHSHEDHWTPHELTYRRPGFSLVPEDAPLTIYGNATVREATEKEVRGDWDRVRMRFQEVEPWKTYPLTEDVSVTPVLAAHDPSEVCLNYLIQVGGSNLLIAHDTGWWEEETWSFLKGRPLDVVLMDSTSGKADSNRYHLSCNWVVKARERLAESGSLAEGCRFYATHFSHNGGWLHHELEEYFQPHGVLVAYDGLRIPL